jgi:hypothetical protein
MPLSMSARSRASDAVAGPMVQTIFVRRWAVSPLIALADIGSSVR